MIIQDISLCISSLVCLISEGYEVQLSSAHCASNNVEAKYCGFLKGKEEVCYYYNLGKGLGLPHFGEVLLRGFQLKMVHHMGLSLAGV